MTFKKIKNSYVPLSCNDGMNGGMLLEREPRKSPKWKPIDIPEEPRSRSSESVTKWPRWLLPNTSSHSTGMGAKLVLIEGVIHRCSPLSEGGSRHELFLTFSVSASAFLLGHEEKKPNRTTGE